MTRLVLAALVLATVATSGCATRKDPGAWDAGLRYVLTHDCQATADPWHRC